jgi:uncharacterized membrane protein YeaQ/YmgE (transglycosylase-associated protein family)
MWSIIITIIVAIVIGSIGDAIAGGRMPGGFIGSLIAGLAGAWLGTYALGVWGPVIAGFAVIPAIIGATLFVFLIGLLGRLLRSV